MPKPYFNAYDSYFESLEPLSDAECGRLFMACLKYHKTGAETEFRGNERFIWPTMKSQIDRDNEKYAETCEKNRQNANQRYQNEEATAIERMRPQSNACEHLPEEGKGEGKGKGENKETLCEKTIFENLWKMYPNKKGKGQVSDKDKRLIAKIGEDEMERAINRYIDGLNRDEWREPQNGSTFFHSGYVDYLDSNYPDEEKTESDPEEGKAFEDAFQAYLSKYRLEHDGSTLESMTASEFYQEWVKKNE